VIAAAASAAALAFSVSPVRLTVRAGARAAIAVRAPGSSAAVVDAAVASYALDLRGRPRVGAPHGAWLRLPKTRVALRGGVGAIPLAAAAPRGAAPGDHPVGLVLTLGSRARSGTVALLRVVVAVVVRVPGRLRRRLAVLRLGLAPGRPRVLRLVLGNRGDVDEQLGPRILVVRLRRGGKVAAVLRPLRRRLLAHTRGFFEWRLPAALHGRVTASLVLPLSPVPQTYPLRL
jgi:hypothetical protein